MIARTIRKVLLISVFTAIFIPGWALAVLADSSRLIQQSARFGALNVAASIALEEMVSQLMVKPRHQVGEKLKTALRAHDASALVKTSNIPMSVVREMSGDAHVIRLDHPVTLSEARVIAARLMQDTSVEMAEPDRRKRATFTPTDPSYAGYQWNLFAPVAANLGSANLPTAWSITTGSKAVTVAVIDTGYRPHADLGAVVLQGYDFITDVPTANDGNGRDADAQDSGDWITGADNTAVGGAYYKCGALDSRNRPLNQLTPSSWHGTHVAGIIAAQMNSIGIAGIAPNINILPVRVLGKCGGYDSDIIDAMRWAAGIAVAGTPVNTHPAQVLNMSLGGTGGAPCTAAYQSAVADVIAAGKVIVVAAGNDGASTLSSPANCAGVLAVTANSIDGDNAYYATIGPGTTISAPGGDCGGMSYPRCTTANSVGVYSLLNSGTTTPVASPGGDIYVAYSGTSMATPHVAAVAALMFSLNPSLTPAQIKSYLQSTSRPFPSNTICTTSGAGLCGAGLLDAYQALIAVQPSSAISSPVVTLGSIPSAVTSGTQVTLSGSAVAGTGRSITSYAWTQLTGIAVTLNKANTANATFTPFSTGSYSFMLTATDNGGQSGTATASIAVNSPPPVPNPVVTLSSTPSTVTAGTVVTLSGSAVAGTGRNIASYSWTQQSGPSTVVISNANTANATFTATSAGTYHFTLSATDSSGQTGSATVVVVVNASPPVVSLDSIPSIVAPGDIVPLSGSAAAGKGQTIASYAWTQFSGPTTVAINYANTANASFTAPATGSYSFKLTATDRSGQTGIATTAAIVVNSPPVLTTPVQTQLQSVVAGKSLNFTVSASDVDGDIPIFHTVSLPAGATLSATGIFSWPNASPAGSYTMTYYASDNYAKSLNGTVSITVTAPPSSPSGGGGSMDAELLAALAMLAGGLRWQRRYAKLQK